MGFRHRGPGAQKKEEDTWVFAIDAGAHFGPGAVLLFLEEDRHGFPIDRGGHPILGTLGTPRYAKTVR